MTKAVYTLLLFCLQSHVQLQAQAVSKPDTLYLLDGTRKIGTVTSQTDDAISFVHQNESLSYPFARHKVHKIVFSSGRSELLNPASKTTSGRYAGDTRNRVAVVPLNFIGEGNNTRMEEMRYRLQELVISYLQDATHELKYQDAAETNALLRKHGITDYNMRQYTPKDLAEILGVTYVIMGSVSQDYGNTTTTTNSQQQGNRSFEAHGGKLEQQEKQKSSTVSTTSQNVQTDVTLSIYNDQGEKIFTRSRHSILSTVEAYKNSLRYLLKRTPLYKR